MACRPSAARSGRPDRESNIFPSSQMAFFRPPCANLSSPTHEYVFYRVIKTSLCKSNLQHPYDNRAQHENCHHSDRQFDIMEIVYYLSMTQAACIIKRAYGNHKQKLYCLNCPYRIVSVGPYSSVILQVTGSYVSLDDCRGQSGHK